MSPSLGDRHGLPNGYAPCQTVVPVCYPVMVGRLVWSSCCGHSCPSSIGSTRRCAACALSSLALRCRAGGRQHRIRPVAGAAERGHEAVREGGFQDPGRHRPQGHHPLPGALADTDLRPEFILYGFG